MFDMGKGNFEWIDPAWHTQAGKVRLGTFLTVWAGKIGWREGRLIQMGQC